MESAISQPKSSFHASPLPTTRPWRVHVICLFKIGGFTSLAAYLVILGYDLARIPSSYLTLPPILITSGISFLTCFMLSRVSLAVSVYRWGRKVLYDANPVPLIEQ